MDSKKVGCHEGYSASEAFTFSEKMNFGISRLHRGRLKWMNCHKDEEITNNNAGRCNKKVQSNCTLSTQVSTVNNTALLPSGYLSSPMEH